MAFVDPIAQYRIRIRSGRTSRRVVHVAGGQIARPDHKEAAVSTTTDAPAEPASGKIPYTADYYFWKATGA